MRSFSVWIPTRCRYRGRSCSDDQRTSRPRVGGWFSVWDLFPLYSLPNLSEYIWWQAISVFRDIWSFVFIANALDELRLR